MARICILWEDFITDGTGAAADSLPDLDGNSPQWRRFFFLRHSIGTLHEIRIALQHLRCQKEFKIALTKRPQAEQRNFKNALRYLQDQEETIKELRDRIGGGHVLQKAVRDGLNKMDPWVQGIIQIGESYKNIRFKFAHRLALETMFPGHEERDPDKEVEKFLRLIEQAVHHALKMMEFVFSVYVQERRLTPM